MARARDTVTDRQTAKAAVAKCSCIGFPLLCIMARVVGEWVQLGSAPLFPVEVWPALVYSFFNTYTETRGKSGCRCIKKFEVEHFEPSRRVQQLKPNRSLVVIIDVSERASFLCKGRVGVTVEEVSGGSSSQSILNILNKTYIN